MKVQFINHASVKIYAGDSVVLTDPWYSGNAFDDGWSLLSPGPGYGVVDDVTHIWVSHEHPDHFSPAFFKAMPPDARQRIEVLFQQTRDGRVAKFLRGLGFRVRCVGPKEEASLGGSVRIRVGPVGFYDSWLWVTDGQKTLLNLNDCPTRGVRDLDHLRNLLGKPDVLLTQFSYAAWKGGKDHRAYRETAAQSRLDDFIRQVEGLDAKCVIPFASFVWFSHQDNAFLNDAVNTLDDVLQRSDEFAARVVAMKPMQEWTVGETHDNSEAQVFWRSQFASIPARRATDAGKSVPLDRLEQHFERYQARMNKQNWPVAIKLARYNPVVRGFLPVHIHITDHDVVVRVSIVDGFRIVHHVPVHASMHSSSLDLIFRMDFGFDTLTVNGRFEATPDGFSRMTRSFALGSLNAMGLHLGPRLVTRADVVLKLLSLLRTVRSRLDQAPASA